jgi:branched-subunit amino acid ABC-type transport system permease component
VDLKPFIVAGLAMGSVYALSGVGLTVLYRTTGVVNFAYGAIGALGALVGWQLLQDGTPEAVTWLAAISVSTAVSLAYGVLVAPRLALRDPVTNAAATLGLTLVLLGFTRVAWEDDARSYPLPTDDWTFTVFDVRVVGTQVMALVLALALTAAVGVFLARSRTGLSLRAMAQDRELSGMLGIQVTRTGAVAWAGCGALAGISGLLVANLVRLDAATLTVLVVPGIAAAIIGRLESLPLVCAGGVAIGVLEAIGTPYDSIASYRSIGPLLVAALALLVYQARGQLLNMARAPAAEVASARAVSGARRASQAFRDPAGIAAGLIAVVVLVPGLASAAWLSTLTSCVIFAIAAAGVGVLYSRLGLASLAQVALVGLGGWVMLRLHFWLDAPFLVTMVLAGLITAAAAIVLGLPALRLRGLYLSLVTLMIAAGFDIAFNAAGFPNGGSSFLGYEASGELQRLGRPDFAVTDEAYFRFAAIVAAIMLVIAAVHLVLRPGRAWALIKRSDVAASSAGVSLPVMQSWAFALAGLLSGIAGALLAGHLGQLSPSTFPVTDSMLLFGLVVIAGAHHWAGWIIAAVLYKVVPFGLDELGVDGNYSTIIFGVALMASLLGSEVGIVGDAQAKIRSLRGRKRKAVPAT